MSDAPAQWHALITALLGRAEINAKVQTITPCALGGNNRIYRVETTAGTFAAKQYFRHEGDTRDRLASEYAFLTYAKIAVPESVPRPYACDPESGLALYEFVEGRPFRSGGVGAQHVDAAIRFFQALNALPLRASAQLPVASEACFSIAEHLALIDTRIGRLLEVIPASDIDSEALGFFRRLNKVWRQLAENIRSAAQQAELSFDTTLPAQQRCISPSDFGFHNAVAEADGRIRFLDFEYAGWDDPAKTAGDFFAQLAVPVPPEYFDHFVTASMSVFPEPEMLIRRASLLRPVYQTKWCCIALNVFIQVHFSRRKFANPDLDEAALKKAQLSKAEKIFQSIQDSPWPTLI